MNIDEIIAWLIEHRSESPLGGATLVFGRVELTDVVIAPIASMEVDPTPANPRIILLLSTSE